MIEQVILNEIPSEPSVRIPELQVEWEMTQYLGFREKDIYRIDQSANPGPLSISKSHIVSQSLLTAGTKG